MTPGYKTSEFWLSLLAMIIGSIFASGLVGEGGAVGEILGMSAVILGKLGYTVPRGLAKAKQATPVVVPAGSTVSSGSTIPPPLGKPADS